MESIGSTVMLQSNADCNTSQHSQFCCQYAASGLQIPLQEHDDETHCKFSDIMGRHANASLCMCMGKCICHMTWQMPCHHVGFQAWTLFLLAVDMDSVVPQRLMNCLCAVPRPLPLPAVRTCLQMPCPRRHFGNVAPTRTKSITAETKRLQVRAKQRF